MLYFQQKEMAIYVVMMKVILLITNEQMFDEKFISFQSVSSGDVMLLTSAPREVQEILDVFTPDYIVLDSKSLRPDVQIIQMKLSVRPSIRGVPICWLSTNPDRMAGRNPVNVETQFFGDALVQWLAQLLRQVE